MIFLWQICPVVSLKQNWVSPVPTTDWLTPPDLDHAFNWCSRDHQLASTLACPLSGFLAGKVLGGGYILVNY